MFTTPILGKSSIGSPVQYWERFFVPQTSTGIGSIVSPDLYWENVYRFPSPVVRKGSIGSPVQYWEKVLGS